MKNNVFKLVFCVLLFMFVIIVVGIVLVKVFDDVFDCYLIGYKFVVLLFVVGDIQLELMYVELNLVNVFCMNYLLMVYGFGVYVVFGYQVNDLIFCLGDGMLIGDWVYGVVVCGMKGLVEEVVCKVGSDVIVKQVFLFLIVIVCLLD